MPTVSQAAEAWATSIRRALVSSFRRAETNTKIVLTPDEVSVQALQRYMADGEFVSKVLTDFIRDKMLRKGGEWSFGTQYQKRTANPSEYFPKFGAQKRIRNSLTGDDYVKDEAQKAEFARGDGTSTGSRRRIFMDRGFDALWDVFSQPVPVRQDRGTFRFGVGPKQKLIKDLRLGDFMGSSKTNSDMNSLFLAVEFGTGIAANVGGSQWVRRGSQYPAKDPSGDGSWWTGGKPGSGTRVYGQKGFHFLYDAASRRPHPEYADYFRTEFPKFFISAVKRHIEGR
jgi:hypothetical protein